MLNRMEIFSIIIGYVFIVTNLTQIIVAARHALKTNTPYWLTLTLITSMIEMKNVLINFIMKLEEIFQL